MKVRRILAYSALAIVGAGIAAYTTEEEVDRLLEGVAAAARS